MHRRPNQQGPGPVAFVTQKYYISGQFVATQSPEIPFPRGEGAKKIMNNEL